MNFCSRPLLDFLIVLDGGFFPFGQPRISYCAIDVSSSTVSSTCLLLGKSVVFRHGGKEFPFSGPLSRLVPHPRNLHQPGLTGAPLLRLGEPG